MISNVSYSYHRQWHANIGNHQIHIFVISLQENARKLQERCERNCRKRARKLQEKCKRKCKKTASGLYLIWLRADRVGVGVAVSLCVCVGAGAGASAAVFSQTLQAGAPVNFLAVFLQMLHAGAPALPRGARYSGFRVQGEV